MLGRGIATQTFVASMAVASSSRLDTLITTTIMETTDTAVAAISTAGPSQPAVRTGGIATAPAATETSLAHGAAPLQRGAVFWLNRPNSLALLLGISLFDQIKLLPRGLAPCLIVRARVGCDLPQHASNSRSLSQADRSSTLRSPRNRAIAAPSLGRIPSGLRKVRYE
jgi:hypothetical protein